MIPARPIVENPVMVSCAVQDILGEALTLAQDSYLEKYGHVVSWPIQELTDKVEYYKIAEYFVGKAVPSVPSEGIPKDRAEARLLLWDKLFGGDDYIAEAGDSCDSCGSIFEEGAIFVASPRDRCRYKYCNTACISVGATVGHSAKKRFIEGVLK